MRAAFRAVLERQRKTREILTDLEERVERLKRTREECAADRALLNNAVISLERNGIRVRKARDSDESVRIIFEELSGERILVKSKSNISREIGLSQALSEAGVEVVETDIGDRIIQLAGEPPVHPTGPSAHMDRYEIASALENSLGTSVEPKPSAIIRAILENLMPKLEASSVGLTGVNAITSSEGALLFVHNEGNIGLVSSRRKKLIVLATPEKIYPNLEEAINMVRVETYYATGQSITSYISILTGPSRTADIEKEVHLGVHGPSDILVIFVDNGRESLAGDKDLRPLLECIGCGSCLLECPVYEMEGPTFGSPGHLGGAGVCFVSNAFGAETGKQCGLSKCLTCRSCVLRCPVSIDTPRIVEKTRSRALGGGHKLADAHDVLVKSIRNYSNPYLQPKSIRDRWARGITFAKEKTGKPILFYAGCSLSYVRKDVAVSAVKILQACGLELTYLGKNESCCGSTILKIGKEDVFLTLAKQNIENFHLAKTRSIVTVCPGCLTALRRYREYFTEFDIPVEHITEIVSRALEEGKISLKIEPGLKVTFHDPCHLARENSILNEPRMILQSIEGIELVEMERSGESTMCCGSGGGVKTAHPDLAVDIGARKIKMAVDTGAELLVTCCPWCEINLEEASTTLEGSPKVINILSLLEKGLKS